MRRLAIVAPIVPLGGGRARLDEILTHAGDWLGLDVDEFIALSMVSAAGGVGLGAAGVTLLDLPGIVLPFLGGLAAALPYILVTGEVQARAKAIDRALPGAIDLASLCMTAGLAFPGALVQIVSKSPDPEDPLNEELSLILQQLRLGWTRRRALESFASRVPSEAVRSFVSAAVQSEERGTPLAEVLQIQATTLRQRRSTKGEEAASRAAVLMLLPLLLIMCSILVLLLGPFLIRGAASGI
ncbi:MAG: type II secretion system F family protein [Sandaracinaceae bacterium]|nr:type II secretion system F family protein [Sandaracinaceae bacterium]